MKALIDGGRMSATIIIIVAAIGLIVGLIQVSGFSGRLALLLAQLADGPLFLTLIVVALGSIVLGMGLPPAQLILLLLLRFLQGLKLLALRH